MENKLIQYFSKITKLSPEECKAITDSMETLSLKKDTLLLQEGQEDEQTYFILKGCIRQYKIIDGEQVTTNFFTEDQWIISLANAIEKTPSLYYLVCAEDTIVVVGNEEKAMALFQNFPRFETISRKVMETVYFEYQQRMSKYISDTPEERYLDLLKSRPDIFQRLPQYQIASYLGVKPESLSRIRKKIQLKD